ncbi:MAG: ATP citrate lyase citrate-binding domain-containing protein [Myxococcota bacterium]
MARKGIREYDAKRMLATAITGYEGQVVLVGPGESLKDKVDAYPWLKTEKLVAKPDQLFGKRGKNDLICLNKDINATDAWIQERMNKDKTLLSGVTGTLTHFIVERFTPFEKDTQEYYISLELDVNGDILRLSNAGGVDVEEHMSDESKFVEVVIDGDKPFESKSIAVPMGKLFPEKQHKVIGQFIEQTYKHFCEGGYTFLEINPFVVIGDKVQPLDMVAKVDDTAAFECRSLWGDIEYPAAFGEKLTDAEAFVRELDSKTGSSLKLTILNPKGRVWNMVAGGGASVVYADTVCDLGFANELAMYGEYSGNPDKQNTYYYAKTVIEQMTAEKDPQGRPKFLLVGGGIANFTDVAKTFRGIIMAMEELAPKMKEADVRVYVRRGGPNYKEGLSNIKAAAEKLGIPIQVHGPETHMTQIVADALQK